jgi:hypothetical protein
VVLKGKKIIFCLPGKQFSNNFLTSWSDLLLWCVKQGITVHVKSGYSPLLYYVRNMCLGGNTMAGIKQLPYGGRIDYDYMMWIDSDQVFKPEHLEKLLNDDKDIVSGLYMMCNGEQYATVENIDHEFFKTHGGYQFLTKDDIQERTELFKVDYTGFGWVLVKYGVFESLEYPWFRPYWTEYEIGNRLIKDFSMEDAAFCIDIKEKGYDIWVDPTVIVGHEKMMIL